MPIEIKMPALSPTMTQGNLAKWIVKEGDKVSAGDVLAEVETDKAMLEVEASEDGVMAKLIIPNNTNDIPIGQVIAIMANSSEQWQDINKLQSAPLSNPINPSTPDPLEAKQSNKAEPQQFQSLNNANQTTESNNGRVFATPLAKNIAISRGIDIKKIGSGSGPEGRITKFDVERFSTNNGNSFATEHHVPSPTIQPNTLHNTSLANQSIVASESQTFTPASPMRRAIAKRLLESKNTIPHFYLTTQCNVTKLSSVRNDMNELLAKHSGAKISFNDIMIKAASVAIKMHPEINVSWDSARNGIISYQNIDISFAVSIPDGLITPIIFNTGNMSLSEISSQAKPLIKRAREGSLKPHEFEGGTFCISNLGNTGVNEFYAIINPPQSAILAVGSVFEGPTFDSNDEIVKGLFMNVSLSADHRAIDGEKAALFLATLKNILENPSILSL